jgi:hypothetical protein
MHYDWLRGFGGKPRRTDQSAVFGGWRWKIFVR